MEYVTLLITVLLGIPGVLIYLKQKKSTLYFIKARQINLQQDLLKNFENLTIKYEDTEINDKITFIKGHILYSGDKDITEKQNILEVYDKSISWLNFKITNVSKGLLINSTIENEKVIIDFGLLKNNEFFEFEGLINNNNIESKKQDDIKLKFFHRIPNIPQVEELDNSMYGKKNNFLFYGLIYVILGSYVINDTSNIKSYFVKAYNSVTHSEMKDYHNFRYSDSYENVIDKLNQDYFGFELYFFKSKSYNFQYKTIDGKTEKVSTYFIRDDYLNLIFSLFSFIILIIGILMLFVYFFSYRQKKYINLINANR